MQFSTNHPILFLITGAVIAVVLAQSIYFLRKAMSRAKEIGMDDQLVRKVIRTAAIFTVAPAVAIVIGVITLSKNLGLPLPWLRLSVIGSLSYETIAASNALTSMGLKLGAGNAIDAQSYVTVLFVMTLSILGGITLVSFIGPRLNRGTMEREKRDRKWSEVFNNAMFIGMISAFVGFIFCDVDALKNGQTYGLIPVFVFFFAMLIMGLCAFLMKKFKWAWINDYALPIALVAGMAIAIPLTAWLG